jgi:hypothetical protein
MPGRRRIVPARTCLRCGGALAPVTVDRYDPFWTTLLILGGTALAFYLVGLPMIASGLWLRTRKTLRWVCAVCAGSR